MSVFSNLCLVFDNLCLVFVNLFWFLIIVVWCLSICYKLVKYVYRTPEVFAEVTALYCNTNVEQTRKGFSKIGSPQFPHIFRGKAPPLHYMCNETPLWLTLMLCISYYWSTEEQMIHKLNYFFIFYYTIFNKINRN